MPSSEVSSAPHEAWVLIPEWLRRPGVPWGSPKFWIIQAAVLATMGFHTLVQRGLDGRDATGIPAPLTSSLMLILVLYAALAFGVAGAIATSLWATALFGLHWLVVHGEPVTNAHLWIEFVSLIVL